MVAEKAKRLEHEDMVALSLLVGGFNLLPDRCRFLHLCTRTYAYAMEYSFLSYNL